MYPVCNIFCRNNNLKYRAKAIPLVIFMANRHIKVINGRKYFYESVRKGKKVTSRYLGPAEQPLRKTKKIAEADSEQEENYIG